MPELDDLETLADDIRATAPQPRDAYLARLEQRVEAGFPKPRRKRRRDSLWTPALALAVCTVLALVVAVGVLRGGSDDARLIDASSGSSAAEPAQEMREGGSAAGADEAAAPTPQLSGAAARRGSDRRVVERRTTLELAPGRDAFAEVTAEVLRIADASDTIVQRSNMSERDGRGLATYDLRVPSSQLDDVLAQLSELAPVTSRTASSQDITAPYTTATARLDDARQERASLLRALARADSEAEADALRARVRNARARISRAEADVRRLQARSNRARVDVTVASTGRDGDGGAWTPGDALDDAGRVLEVAAGIAVVTGAVLLPFALLSALAAATARATRRRRREAALG